MAEYLIQDTTLTAIADAIRSKTETTDAILTANMAALIEGIEAGGGSNISIGTITMATTIEIVNGITITHNLGTVPTFGLLLVLPYSKTTIDKSEPIIYGGYFTDSKNQAIYFCPNSYYGPFNDGSASRRYQRDVKTDNKNNNSISSVGSPFWNATESTICFSQGTDAHVSKFYPGWEYIWLMGA